ncbi:MAG: endopeptidase La [Eubacterium sp.]|nr:endopeptidase La [Eubacterium sp.]
MKLIPLYDVIILPDVTFYFKKEIVDEWQTSDFKEGEEIVFAILKSDVDLKEAKASDISEIGVKAVVEIVDAERDIKIVTKERVTILNCKKGENGIFDAEVELRPETKDISDEEAGERFDKIKSEYLKFIQQYQWGLWARSFMIHWKNMNELCCSMSSYFVITPEEKYKIVEIDSEKERFDYIENIAYEFMEMAKVHNEAEDEQQKANESIYRESALKKQIDILQKQLDEMHPENISDVRMFQKKIEESGMNEQARREAEKVLNRMKHEGQDGHEYGMLYDYLDFATALDWKKKEAESIDLSKAEEVLDKDHYGLKKVKDRIIQQLAVMALNKKQSGSILLFVGPPGTGKTSIGQSIAEALGRKYVRISLGGIRDEAEIRGHRRTYIGAMPGRIMEGIKQAGSSNPVMVLDEVDKLVHDFSGDPASALLEVLDPEQNFSFTDHYMNVPYDLSDVFFICTANSLGTIPEPLLNRMEVINFSGYTAVDKFNIAKKHLVPKAMKMAGLKKKQINITDTAIRKIISDYTAEAGVRGLKKRIDDVMRYAAVKVVKGEEKISVKPDMLHEYLGKRGIIREEVPSSFVPGIVTGLAWTEAGGEILYIETKKVKGQGKVIITGQLGDVMRESVEIALTIVRGMLPEETKDIEKLDIHIHVPEGAVPKDGPSAGITIVTALTSLFTKKKVDPHIAMTGEVSLRGYVMPIGGLTEKLMAATRAGVKKVFIPDRNEEDLEDIPDEVKEKLEIVSVKKITDVLSSLGLK